MAVVNRRGIGGSAQSDGPDILDVDPNPPAARNVGRLIHIFIRALSNRMRYHLTTSLLNVVTGPIFLYLYYAQAINHYALIRLNAALTSLRTALDDNNNLIDLVDHVAGMETSSPTPLASNYMQMLTNHFYSALSGLFLFSSQSTLGFNVIAKLAMDSFSNLYTLVGAKSINYDTATSTKEMLQGLMLEESICGESSEAFQTYSSFFCPPNSDDWETCASMSSMLRTTAQETAAKCIEQVSNKISESSSMPSNMVYYTATLFSVLLIHTMAFRYYYPSQFQRAKEKAQDAFTGVTSRLTGLFH